MCDYVLHIIFNTIVYAYEIRDMVNTRTSSSSVPTPALVLSPTFHVTTLTSMLKVDQLADITVTLMVWDPTYPLASTKRAQEDEPQSPQIEAFQKWTRVVEDNAYEEATPFIKIQNVFSSLSQY